MIQPRISICNLTEVFGMPDEQTLSAEICGCEIYTVGTEGSLSVHHCPLHAKAKEMREMLRRLEWVTAIGQDESHCARCTGWRSAGHFGSCELQTLLKEIDNG